MALGSYKTYFLHCVVFYTFGIIFFPNNIHKNWEQVSAYETWSQCYIHFFFFFLASKSLTQGLNSVTKLATISVVPRYLSFPIRAFLLVPSSLCTAVRVVTLNRQESPLPKKWFVCFWSSLLKQCDTGSGAISPPGAGMGWVCSGHQAVHLRPWWSYQNQWMNWKSVIPIMPMERCRLSHGCLFWSCN